MREIVFRVLEEWPGRLIARSEDGSLQICAPTREELHHEAREALIAQRGSAHVAFRIRLLKERPAGRHGPGRALRSPGTAGPVACCAAQGSGAHGDGLMPQFNP